MSVVYVDGVFDLFHAGHINFLKKAKELGDTLIVGIISDDDVKSYKRTPIIPFEDRYSVIENCKLIDKVIPKSPLIITEEFLETHNINIVVHGDDSTQESFFKIPIEKGIMKYVKYTDHISTTKIINKITMMN
tara:strand:+ start:1505 stop:1903 length:399 start_codon:yes stop_codon:yes gene_type:complete